MTDKIEPTLAPDVQLPFAVAAVDEQPSFSWFANHLALNHTDCPLKTFAPFIYSILSWLATD